MKLETNKVFGTKLTAEQIETIENILDFSGVNIDDLKTKGDVLNVILDNFSFEKKSPSGEIKEDTVLKTDTEIISFQVPNELTSFHKELVKAILSNKVLVDLLEKEILQKEPEKVKLKISEQLSSFHKELLESIVGKEDVIKFLRKYNKEGKFNGVYDVIDTEDKEQNILNLLTSIFTYVVFDKQIFKSSVVKYGDMKKNINDFINKEE